MDMFGHLGGGVDLDKPKSKSKIYSDVKMERWSQSLRRKKERNLTKAENFYTKARNKGIEQYRQEKEKKQVPSYASKATLSALNRFDRRGRSPLPSVTSLFRQRGTQKRIYI